MFFSSNFNTTPNQQTQINKHKTKMKIFSCIPDNKLVKIHDIFNLFCLFIIIIIDLLYLYYTTEYNKIPTELGQNYNNLFLIFFYIFVSYLCIDSIWIIIYPQSIISNPFGILIHHFMCLPLCLVPWYFRRYSWYMIFALISEINTFIIVLRRQFTNGTFLYHICNILFYITWIFLRLVLFTLLCYLYIKEYIIISNDLGTFINLPLLAPIFQISITLLNWKWTFDLLKKSLMKKNSD